MNVARLSFFPDPLHSRRRPAVAGARVCVAPPGPRGGRRGGAVGRYVGLSEPLRRASRGSLRRTCFLRLGFCMRGQVVGVSLREFLLWTGLEESRAQQLRCSPCLQFQMGEDGGQWWIALTRSPVPIDKGN
jgi:hypothetical protein